MYILKHTREFITKNARLLIALALTMLSCKFRFVTNPGISLDSSWVQAINVALENKLVFGRDFVFTYGPLGFLSTRNVEHVGMQWLLMGDLISFGAIFYLLYSYIPFTKWWLPVLIAAMVCLRWSSQSQEYFLLFVLYCGVLILKEKKELAALAFSATLGTLLFFMKINYGLIALISLLSISVFLSFKNRRSAGILLLLSTALFATIYFFVPIDLYGYIKNSIFLAKDYARAMYIVPKLPLNIHKHALYLLIVAACTVIWQIPFKPIKRYTPGKAFFALLIGTATCFLFYKNAFVRYDAPHYEQFFAIFPFFLIAACGILNNNRRPTTIIGAYIVTLFSIWVLPGEDAKLSKLEANDIIEKLSVSDYCKGIYEPLTSENYQLNLQNQQAQVHRLTLLPKSVLNTVGNASIDILPQDITILLKNNLNYQPRPVPQSYSAYNEPLDRLNARFFLSKDRPEYILIRNGGIDERCFAWDESLTKATIQLNYDYLPLPEAATEPMGPILNISSLILLRKRPGPGIEPSFSVLTKFTATAGDTIMVPQNETNPVFVSIKLKNTTLDKIRNLVFLPEIRFIKLLTSDAQSATYRFIAPIMEAPVIVSNSISNDYELKNFLNGHSGKNEKFRSFIVMSEEEAKEMTVTFYKFDNYRTGR